MERINEGKGKGGGTGREGVYLVPEDNGAGGAGVCIDELTRDDTVAEEGLTIGEVCVRLASVGGGIEPAGGD